MRIVGLTYQAVSPCSWNHQLQVLTRRTNRRWKLCVKNVLQVIISNHLLILILLLISSRFSVKIILFLPARSTKDDLFPGVPWLRCGVSGCRKLNIHSSCSYIKLVNCDEKNVTNFCKTFVRWLFFCFLILLQLVKVLNCSLSQVCVSFWRNSGLKLR